MTAKQPVTVDEAMADPETVANTEAVLASFEQAPDIEALIAAKVQAGIEALIPSLVTALSSVQTIQTPNAPSSFVNVSIPTAPQEAIFKKHYRMDNTPEGKFAKLNMAAMRADGTTNPWELDEKGMPLYLMKGEWLTFKADHFFATTDDEVEQIEWMRSHGYARIYEDNGSQMFNCPVTNCGKNFGDYAVLQSHLKATHGLG